MDWTPCRAATLKAAVETPACCETAHSGPGWRARAVFVRKPIQPTLPVEVRGGRERAPRYGTHLPGSVFVPAHVEELPLPVPAGAIPGLDVVEPAPFDHVATSRGQLAGTVLRSAHPGALELRAVLTEENAEAVPGAVPKTAAETTAGVQGLSAWSVHWQRQQQRQQQ